jgi:hypothetical protein
MHETMPGYCFVPADRTLHDGRKLRVGKLHRLSAGAETSLRARGYPAFADLLDALNHAQGPVFCCVELRGTIVSGAKKSVASQCKVLSAQDVTSELHELALWCAERACKSEREAGREPDVRSWRALAVMRAWLHGDATPAQASAAYTAARAAVLATKGSAARSPARAAAVSAAHTIGAASHAPMSWVRSAVYWAARACRSTDTERSAQSRKLQRLVVRRTAASASAVLHACDWRRRTPRRPTWSVPTVECPKSRWKRSHTR